MGIVGLRIGSFDVEQRTLEVVLVHTGEQDPARRPQPGEEAYPIHCRHRYAALARDGLTKEVLGVLEFYSRPADPFDPRQLGSLLIEKAISVDKNHLRRGIAYNLYKAVLEAGYLVILSGHFTERGLALARKLKSDGVALPTCADVTTAALPLPGR